MKMKEFAEVVKESRIVGKNTKTIIFILLQALGAEQAISDMSMASYSDNTKRSANQSPSPETIKSWFNGSDPDTVRYFPNHTVKDKENEAHKFLWKHTGKDKWKELRNSFKEWHDKNQSGEAFYINTETDDFHTFSTSFWKQFVSFFKSLRMWDDAEGSYGIKDEIMKIFKEKFIQYGLYKFIPKDIENVIESLYIYHEILDENAKLAMQEGSTPDCDTAHNAKKMYCKLYPSHDNFIFYAVIGCNGFWRLQIPEKCILLKFPESFEYDMIPTNTWRPGSTESIEYAIVDPIPEDEKFNGEELPWEKCQGDIIFIGIDIPTKIRGSANEGITAETTALADENTSVDQDISADGDIPDDGDCTIIADCYVLIDGMLELDSSIDAFIKIIKEKIIKKYECVTFDDNSRQLYNDIKQYRKSLKKLKKYLIRLRNLEKEKSQYLSDQEFVKQFGMYSAFSGYESSPKPRYPFSERYLDPREAFKVESKLYHYHQNLMELYSEIIG